jgi:hypothetical protein
MASQEKKEKAPDASAKGKAKGKKKTEEDKTPLTPLALLEHNCSLLKREPLERRFVTRALRKLNIVRWAGIFKKKKGRKKKALPSSMTAN